jgi:hypothetical protein
VVEQVAVVLKQVVIIICIHQDLSLLLVVVEVRMVAVVNFMVVEEVEEVQVMLLQEVVDLVQQV